MKNKNIIIILILIILNIVLLKYRNIDLVEANNLSNEIKKLNNEISKIEEREINDDKNFTSDSEFREKLDKVLKSSSINKYNIFYDEMKEEEEYIVNSIILEFNTSLNNIILFLEDIKTNEYIKIDFIDIVPSDNEKIKFTGELIVDFKYDNKILESDLINEKPFMNKIEKEKNKVNIKDSNNKVNNKDKENTKDIIKKDNIKDSANNHKSIKVQENKEINDNNINTKEKEILKEDKITQDYIELVKVDNNTIVSFININSLRESKEEKLFTYNYKTNIEYISFIMNSNFNKLDTILEIDYMENNELKHLVFENKYNKNENKLYFYDLKGYESIKEISFYIVLPEGNIKNYIVIKELELGMK